jgi:amino acid adenylation domain-containing protein
VVAILAALKAGKFYMILDPSDPLARQRAVVEHAGPALLISEARHLRAGAWPGAPLPALAADQLPGDLAGDDLDLPVGPEAYLNLMYTSGSTGRPKGVIQTHGNVLHDLRPRNNGFTFHAGDRVALVVPFGFGASVSNIFGALLNGAALHPFALKQRGVVELAQWLLDEQITIYHSVPTVFRHLLAHVPPGRQFPDLRVVKLGGEPVMLRDVELFRRHCGDDALLRVTLGTTETYMATLHLIDKRTPLDTPIVPIGYPDEDKEILILDDRGQPLPPGEIGEIAVKSRYLSPGYWREPELTAQKYLRDPDGSDARIYLSGDLGRQRPDGCYEHLGRKDDQVKIRGNRVELAEVEMALLDLPGVAAAAVTDHERRPGERVLAAYVVPAPGAALDAAALRAALADHLPEYMVPSAFASLERLPLLPFGKVNRGALPAPDWAALPAQRRYAAPRSDLQAALARIWGECLGLEQVGIHDSFYELGGNSLTAAQLTSRVRAECQVNLPLQALLAAPTVAEMAAIITAGRMGGSAAPTQPQEDELARARRLLGAM